MLVTETPDSPPVAHEDLLVEDGAVGAEEGDRVEGVRGDGVPQTHVVRLQGNMENYQEASHYLRQRGCS